MVNVASPSAPQWISKRQNIFGTFQIECEKCWTFWKILIFHDFSDFFRDIFEKSRKSRISLDFPLHLHGNVKGNQAKSNFFEIFQDFQDFSQKSSKKKNKKSKIFDFFKIFDFSKFQNFWFFKFFENINFQIFWFSKNKISKNRNRKFFETLFSKIKTYFSSNFFLSIIPQLVLFDSQFLSGYFDLLIPNYFLAQRRSQVGFPPGFLSMLSWNLTCWIMMTRDESWWA